MILYPTLLDLRGKLCVIVGGGEVARRKIEHLLEAGAHVRVVAPKIHRTIRDWAKDGQAVELVARTYSADSLDGRPRLVFACTDDPAVNGSVAEDAGELGIDVNRADDPKGSAFHVPSMVRREDLLLTVSTGGQAPALAREVCHRLEQQFGPAWGEFVELLGQLRQGWQAKGENAQIHARMLEIISSDTFEVMQLEGKRAARKHALSLVRKSEKA